MNPDSSAKDLFEMVRMHIKGNSINNVSANEAQNTSHKTASPVSPAEAQKQAADRSLTLFEVYLNQGADIEVITASEQEARAALDAMRKSANPSYVARDERYRQLESRFSQYKLSKKSTDKEYKRRPNRMDRLYQRLSTFINALGEDSAQSREILPKADIENVLERTINARNCLKCPHRSESYKALSSKTEEMILLTARVDKQYALNLAGRLYPQEISAK